MKKYLTDFENLLWTPTRCVILIQMARGQSYTHLHEHQDITLESGKKLCIVKGCSKVRDYKRTNYPIYCAMHDQRLYLYGEIGPVGDKPKGRKKGPLVTHTMKHGVWTKLKTCGVPIYHDNLERDPPRLKGEPCLSIAGKGTGHPGYGNCSKHRGNLKGEIKKAAKEEAMEEYMKIMGPAIDVDPMDALLWCVRIAAGEVAYTTHKIELIEEHQELARPTELTERVGGGKEGNYVETKEMPVSLNLWIQVRQNATDRLAKYSKMALDAGVAERQVKVAEQAGDELAMAIRAILDGLELTAGQEQKAPDLVRSALIGLESAKAVDITAA